MNSLNLDVQNFEFLEQEEYASVSLNPTFRWCKFILTDDLPNANKKRIPQDEFDNLIRTGINAPIKMAAREIKEGHNESIPLGVITALQKENNYIKGLAALWSLERPEDVQKIKDLHEKGSPLNLSWEILYSAEEEESDGVVALKNTALRATTFVGMPAYEGRTPVLEVASVQTSIQEDTTLDELDTLKARVAELETSLAEKATELEQLRADNEALAQFKTSVEAEREASEKFSALKIKFKDAGIDKPDEYFDTNKERLLSMDESALDFMVQELVAFSKTATSSTETITVPAITSTNDKLDPKELGRRLRNSKS